MGGQYIRIKNSNKLNKFLHSEVNLLIQHIIVKDQDGQNNNIEWILKKRCRCDETELAQDRPLDHPW